MHILFVCTGNTCRSPMAAYIAKAKAADRNLTHEVSSAGLYAFPGYPMAREAVDALIRRHVVVDHHKSQPLTRELVNKADLIVAMTESHRDDLLAQYPEAVGKTVLLRQFAAGDEVIEVLDVDDPFGCGPDVYEACAELLEAEIERMLDRLEVEGRDDDQHTGGDA